MGSIVCLRTQYHRVEAIAGTAGIAEFEAALADYRQYIQVLVPMFLTWLAEACGAARQLGISS